MRGALYIMARITVEDCLEKTNSRFELVLLAAKRARQLSRGATPLLEEENDKPTVLALREVAAAKVSSSLLNNEGEEDSFEDSHFHANVTTTIEFPTTDGRDTLPDGDGDVPTQDLVEAESAQGVDMTVENNPHILDDAPEQVLDQFMDSSTDSEK